MKKIILTLSIIAACGYTQAQEIKKELQELENTAANEVKTEENKGIQTALTQLVGGINSSSLTNGSTSSNGLLSKLGTATNTAGYGSILSSLASSLKTTSFVSGWSKIKTGFIEKAGQAKSASDLAELTKQLVTNLKSGTFKSGFNKTGLLDALSLVK